MKEAIKLVMKKVANGSITSKEGTQLLIALMEDKPSPESNSFIIVVDEDRPTYYKTQTV